MRIGEVATAAGVNIQTLRYYERRRLLSAPRRRESGYREYTPDAVELVRFVKHAQTLGFKLTEIEELLALRNHASSCSEVRGVAAAKISDIDEKILQLSSIRDSLRKLVTACIRSESSERCAIIEALDERRP
ncbi:MAG: heavy metal-responsive transcriptional regulator [Gemmatimonadaceae bacterium]